MTRSQRLDHATAILCAYETYFADSYRAARALLNSAIFGADVLKFPNGIECRDGHCGCQGKTECLHEIAFKIYAGVD